MKQSEFNFTTMSFRKKQVKPSISATASEPISIRPEVPQTPEQPDSLPSLSAPPIPGAGLRVLSFFTGCGGLDLGFEQAGFDTVYATDIDRDSCETLALNLGIHFKTNLQIVQTDIATLDPRTLPDQIDLIIGGPPCQSFSASGRRAGGAAGRLDKRGLLFESYCKIIAHVKPKAFVFENVRGIFGHQQGRGLEGYYRDIR